MAPFSERICFTEAEKWLDPFRADPLDESPDRSIGPLAAVADQMISNEAHDELALLIREAVLA
jgi:hypothetical protein